MTHVSSEINTLHPALAGRVGAEGYVLALAQGLHKTGPVENTSYNYLLFNILDSLSSSYSMFKYGFDLVKPEGGADLMHEVMLTPAGIVTIIAESLFLVSFSFLASLFEKEEEYKCTFECAKPTNERVTEDEELTFDEAKYILKDSNTLYYYPRGKRKPVLIKIDTAQATKLKLIFTRAYELEKNRTLDPDSDEIFGPEVILNEEQLAAIKRCTKHAHESSFKKTIAMAWPYFRDVMKALKNAYKGWRSVIQALRLLGALEFINAVDIKNTILYGGVGLGVLAIINRLLLRKMVEDRKIMMDANAALLVTIKKLGPLISSEQNSQDGPAFEYNTYLNQIKDQSQESRYLSFVGVTAGGFIDGLYLYVGVLSVVTLTQPWLIAISAMCAIYTLTCIVSRLYEEYDYQLRLEITRTKCEIVLITKQMETLFCQADSDSEKSRHKMQDLFAQFEKKRQLLQKQSTHSYVTAAFLGIKNGLYVYSALTSVLFFVSSIILLTGATFPPALLIATVITGLVVLAAFLLHSLAVTYWHSIKQQEKNENQDRPYFKLIKMKNQEGLETMMGLDVKQFQEALQDGLSITPAPTLFYQEWAEVIRSFFSGASKGQKFVDFAGNPAQIKDEKGHYRDTLPMIILGGISALFFSIVLAFRALARGFGRQKIGCGLFSLDETPENVTIDIIEPLLGERCAVIKFNNDELYYADIKNRTLKPIAHEKTNAHQLNKLAKRISGTYKLADEAECELINGFTAQTSQPEDDLAGAVGSMTKVEGAYARKSRFFSPPPTLTTQPTSTNEDLISDHYTFCADDIL